MIRLVSRLLLAVGFL
ncbi:unnamed protein product, partial [Rotaria magnacalcarata]